MGLTGRLVSLKADVTLETSASEIVEHAIGKFDTIYGLANIAGGMPNFKSGDIDRPLDTMGIQYFRDVFTLNVESVFLMSKAASAHFKAKGYGKIVNISSLAAFANRPGLGNATYNAAKKAVIGLSESLSIQLGPDGILVNTIAPGFVVGERTGSDFDDGFKARRCWEHRRPRLARCSDMLRIKSAPTKRHLRSIRVVTKPAAIMRRACWCIWI